MSFGQVLPPRGVPTEECPMSSKPNLLTGPIPPAHGIETFETLFGFIPRDLSGYTSARVHMEYPCPKLYFRAEGPNWWVETRVRLDFDFDTMVGMMRCIVSANFSSPSGDHADPENLAAYIAAVKAAEVIAIKVTSSQDETWNYTEALALADQWEKG